MNQERRKFLQQLASVCAGGVARSLGVGCTAAVATNAAAGATAAVAAVAAPAVAAYGTGIRAQVFEVIVRQALAGAPWQLICQMPMEVNHITEEEIVKEVERRKNSPHNESGVCHCVKCLKNRTEKFATYATVVDSIPHSEKSPCACKTCRDAVQAIVGEALKKQMLKAMREQES